MSSNTDERIRPVDPGRFHQALGVYQAALAAKGPDQGPNNPLSDCAEGGGPSTGAPSGELPGNRGIVAVKREFPDAHEFQSLSLRLQRFAEVLGDKKLIKWGMVRHSEGGVEIHDAVINALAAAPFRKSGVLDKLAFHTLVKAEFAKLEASSP